MHLHASAPRGPKSRSSAALFTRECRRVFGQHSPGRAFDSRIDPLKVVARDEEERSNPAGR